MKLPIVVFTLFTASICYSYDPARHDWPHAALTIAVGGLMAVWWANRRMKP